MANRSCHNGKAAIRVIRTTRPAAKSKRLYAEYCRQCRRLYPALREEFARIAELGD